MSKDAKELHPFRVRENFGKDAIPGRCPGLWNSTPLGCGTLKGCNSIARGETPGKGKTKRSPHPEGVQKMQTCRGSAVANRLWRDAVGTAREEVRPARMRASVNLLFDWVAGETSFS